MSEPPRRYDEREVGLILKRVAELHEREGETASTRSMTRTEIEEVVTDLGIPSALVGRAASELSIRDRRNRDAWWAGGKTDILFESTLDGTISDGTLDHMLEILRRNLGDAGELSQQGSARIWATTRKTTRRILFTVFESDGTSRLRLEERMPDDARATVGGASAAGFFTGIFGMVPIKAILGKAVLMMAMPGIMAGGIAAGWLAGRMLWKRRSAGRESQLQAAFAEILELASARRALPQASDSETQSA